jgi:hypothetical protein
MKILPKEERGFLRCIEEYNLMMMLKVFYRICYILILNKDLHLEKFFNINTSVV